MRRFRTQIAVNRYWEGLTCVLDVFSTWIDAYLNALCAFWMGLICYTCSRSKWIELPPPAARGSQYGYSGGG